MGQAIEVQSGAVTALLNALRQRVDNAAPVLHAIGDDVVVRTKERFATATAPDGSRWAPNTQATLIAYLEKRGGFSGKTGKITAKGAKLAINKRPLQGESGDLARQIFSRVYSGNELLVASSMVYARIQQFGGLKSQFPHLWGDIPARPYFPIRPDGTLYPNEENRIMERLQEYIQGDG